MVNTTIGVIMNNFDHIIRQMDIVPLDVLQKPITIIGAGAVGSYTALQLAKMGFTNLSIYDFDEVSIENMSCQNFGMHQLGMNKAKAICETITLWTGSRATGHDTKWMGQPLKGLVISAADSMATRRKVFEYCAANDLFMIDSRMGAEQIMLYSIQPKYDTWYERTLYTDADAVQLPCTGKATAYCANVIAGLVVKSAVYRLKDVETAHTVLYDIKNDSFEAFRSKASGQSVA